VEKTFAINHVGHALLFHLLAPHLDKGARIVLTSSGTHDPAQKSGLPDAKYTSAEELAHPPAESAKTNGQQRYSTSKLVNILWTYALQRRLLSHPERQLSVVAFDPGLMPGTGLAREFSPLLIFVWKNILPRVIPLLRILLFANIHTAQESGESLAWVAVNDDVAGTSGVYFEGRKEINSSIASHNEKNQEDLWEWTVKNVALNEEETSKFKELR
jgi:NAD(P)-dependent dehydrogenase (short-subunit alcohol dehydrogenase family)